ncbi:MAG: branched-chain amino acid ABC transporter permease [Eubacteriales bacterium]|nr:branched-chain amino acid ABC transporter permease [Eubacteriales bacterium]
MLNSFQEGVLIICCVNVIAVLGMSVLTGFTRLFSFGNAGFMSIGAYAAAIASVQFHLPFPLAVLLGAVAAGVIAYILGSLTIRLRGDYFLISCLGFGECVRVLFNYTRDLTGGANGYSGIPYRTTGIVALGCAIVAFVVAWNFIHSRYGQALSAIRENEVAAATNGINVVRYKKMSFVFSAVYAGWAGALYAHYLQFITPSLFNLGKSSELVITTVLGGLGSLTGSVMGTIIVQILPEIFRSMSEYRMLFYGIAVVLVILVRPNGLYGYREFSLKRCVRSIKNIGRTKRGKESES